jgi:hypothetical protein
MKATASRQLRPAWKVALPESRRSEAEEREIAKQGRVRQMALQNFSLRPLSVGDVLPASDFHTEKVHLEFVYIERAVVFLSSWKTI